MKQRATFELLMMAGFTCLASGQTASPVVREGNYWVRTFSGSVPVDGAAHVRIVTEGNATVHGESGRVITYSMKVPVRARNQEEAESLLRTFGTREQRMGQNMVLELGAKRLTGEGPSVTLTVPRGLEQLIVETRGGDLKVTDLDGDFSGTSAGGRIDIDRLNAAAAVRTAGGDIRVGHVNGPVHCSSGGGSIWVESAGSESWLETAGGDISVHESRGKVHAATGGGNIRVERSGGAVEARTEGGLIEVQQAAGLVNALSSGGAIQVNSAQGVRCEAAAGMIRLRNVAGTLNASTAAGSILAELLAGNRIQDSTLTASAGDITVVISSKVPVTVFAQNVSGGGGRIVSDFPEIRMQPALPGAAPAVAQGSLNGGGPTLRIMATGGTIYLRREK
jgi:Putative adhesin